MNEYRGRNIDTFAARNLKLPTRKLPTESAEYYAMLEEDELDSTICEILENMDNRMRKAVK